MLGLRTTIYKVPDLAKAKAWYSEVFRTEPYFDEPFYIGFEVGGYELGLLPDPMEALRDNIQEEFDRCISLGATVHEAPQNVGDEIVVATVKDPWGNIIGLIYNPHFKTV